MYKFLVFKCYKYIYFFECQINDYIISNSIENTNEICQLFIYLSLKIPSIQSTIKLTQKDKRINQTCKRENWKELEAKQAYNTF